MGASSVEKGRILDQTYAYYAKLYCDDNRFREPGTRSVKLHSDFTADCQRGVTSSEH